MAAKGPNLDSLQDALGYRFKDESLLREALTHGSALSGKSRRRNYQRLEFLGDRVLGLAVADMLLDAFPKADEGDLARRFNALVRREACAEVARTLGLGEYLILGKSEAASGGRRKAALLADVCESLVGAIFKDSGLGPARAFVERHWSERMMTASRPARDAKTALQEWAQGRGLPTPRYEVVAREGPDHAPRFTVRAVVSGLEPAEGEGATKRDAEQLAARAMLFARGVWKPDEDGNG